MAETGETIVSGTIPASDAPAETAADWHRQLAESYRDPRDLVHRLGLPEGVIEPARQAAGSFPLMVPESFLARMKPGDPDDPLLRQVLPVQDELDEQPGFLSDPVDDAAAHRAPGLLQKYAGRALLIATGSCAVHCRYCFRREFPYHEYPRRLDDWEPALEVLAEDRSIHEVILSGGDPLMLTDARLSAFMDCLKELPHIRRLRVHSRLPIVLPSRVTDDLIGLMRSSRLTPIFVVHANHPREIVGDCREALVRLVQSGITTLNQAVLLRGINDDAEVLTELCERLIDIGVMPYYLHQLDRVRGASHFEVDEVRGLALIDELRRRLPGYAVPRYVRELASEPFKRPIV